jgi:hypothetical protein
VIWFLVATRQERAATVVNRFATWMATVVVDEADGDSGVPGRVFTAFAAHIGDSTLRGREVWVAMTSRPDLLAIDMKRQGRFGLCLPLFPAQGPDDVAALFAVVARVKQIVLTDAVTAFIQENLGAQPLTGSDVEAILTRAKERAVLASRDDDVQMGSVADPNNRLYLLRRGGLKYGVVGPDPFMGARAVFWLALTADTLTL